MELDAPMIVLCMLMEAIYFFGPLLPSNLIFMVRVLTKYFRREVGVQNMCLLGGGDLFFALLEAKDVVLKSMIMVTYIAQSLGLHWIRHHQELLPIFKLYLNGLKSWTTI